jgi:hypothetical protein
LGFLLFSTSQTLAAAAQAPADPWTRMPAAPTSCFGQDDFNDRLATYQEQMNAERQAQDTLNAQITEQYTNMDGLERARRLQAFMMRNPQAAMAMMQNVQSAGTQAQADGSTYVAQSLALQQQLTTHIANFRAAVDAAVKPVQARQQAHLDASGYSEITPLSPAAAMQYAALVGQENAAYEAACAPFFRAGGTFPTWFANYRTNAILPQIAGEQAAQAGMAIQFAIMDSPAGGWRSTAAYNLINDFVLQLRNVYNLRSRREDTQQAYNSVVRGGPP